MKPLFLNLPDCGFTINLNYLTAVKLEKDRNLHKDVYHIALRGHEWIKLSPEDSLLLGRTIFKLEVFPEEGGVFPGQI